MILACAVTAEAKDETWADTATGMMWTARDNGKDVNWLGAVGYCQHLSLAGFSDWKIPTLDELSTLFAGEYHSAGGIHIRASIALSTKAGRVWSGTKITEHTVWHLSFGNGFVEGVVATHALDERAICVRAAH